MILYTKWETHTHTKQPHLSVQQNGIYYSCECGYLYEGISINPPTNIIFDNTEKEVLITNTLGINEIDYKVIYKEKKNNDWVTLNTKPIEPGEYKAELTYNDLTAELKYKIYDQIKNPPTVVSNNHEITITIVILLVSFVLVYIYLKQNNKIKVGN